MKGLIIVNPRARSGLASVERAARRDAVTQKLKPVLGTVEWCETKGPGDAVKLAQDAAHNGCDFVLAAGGDGTINEVLNGIMNASRRPIFGVIPWGSLNDFYRAMCLAEQRSSDDPITLPMDVARATFDGVVRYAALSVSIGLASWANQQYLRYSVRLGRILGLIPGAISALFSYRYPQTVQLAINGKDFQAVRMLSASINNSPTVAGGARLTPDESIDDGDFDLCLIPPMSLFQLGFLLAGAYINREIDRRKVMLEPVSRLTIQADQPLPVQVDGELIPAIDSRAKQIEIDVLSRELRVLRPSLLDQ